MLQAKLKAVLPIGGTAVFNWIPNIDSSAVRFLIFHGYGTITVKRPVAQDVIDNINERVLRYRNEMK